MRFCPDCDTPMVHMGYSFVREELHIIPAKVCRIQYYQEKLKCPACEEEGDTTILAARTPSTLLKHSPASPDMVAEVMYQKVFMDLPFYRQEKYWKELGVPLPRETAANWFNTCALEYLEPVYQYLYMLLLYMPDYKEKPAGIEQLLPWSDFIKERCSGVTDTETIRPENRENLPV